MSEKRNSILLDVDPTSLENKLLLQENKDDELNELLPLLQSQPDIPWKLVQPNQGMCVKTRTLAHEKVFINICQTDEIPCPELVDDTKLMQIWTSEEPSSYRVPMSIGEVRQEPDKGGSLCMVYDVAINTTFFKKIETNKLFCQFLLTVVIEGIQDKFEIELNNEETIILKNRKVMGKLQKHRIQQRSKNQQPQKKPLIQEVASMPTSDPSAQGDFTKMSDKREQSSNKTALSTMSVSPPFSIPPSTRQPEYRILLEPPDGDPEFLVGEFKMQDVMGVREVTLDVGEDRIIVESRRRGYLVDVFVPHSINQDSTCAQFNRNTGILTVTMPILASG